MRLDYRNTAIWALLAVLIGLIVGGLDAVFGRILLAVSSFRSDHFYYLIPFLAIAGLATVYIYQRFGKRANKGMGLVFSIGQQSDETIPRRLIPIAMLTTWLTHLFGGSAGREGVAIQIGASVANYLGDLAKAKNRHIMVMVGMAAGFSGLFQTPLAATLFAVEVIVVGSIYYQAILPALIASLVAAQTSHFLGLEKFSYAVTKLPTLNLLIIMKLVVIGIAFGLTGFLFSWLLGKTKASLGTLLPNPYLRIAVGSVILSVLFVVFDQGRYSGLGTNLISTTFSGGPIFAWDFIVKLLLTILTLSIGFQGGEVTPLFAIGATLGMLLGALMGLPLTFVAALGYAAVFAAATNTFFAPILIGCEVFGFSLLPYLLITVSVSYALNFNHSIYTAQKIRKDLLY
ncbi:MAG: chloride channel protein [Lactococcus sp.]|uniref:Voltage-gated chloride channel family protein n=1 Tax=Pseudolactococcus piscium MKFS47 TaxID=297352 RepID=A0A0D6DUC1_9LACT|nr:chloride channel protein [Lactococcus piscium]MBR6894888.1 chloride channel protein [Lactococcus sp.]CEN27564.1 Voltage-gated chloride channel family protein [Lactococcus piscium MKFS47]